MGFFQFYILGAAIAGIMSMLFMLIEPFFHHVMDKELLGDPQIKMYAEQIALAKNKTVYDVLFPLFIFCMAILSYLGIIGIIFLFIDFLADHFEKKKNEQSRSIKQTKRKAKRK